MFYIIKLVYLFILYYFIIDNLLDLLQAVMNQYQLILVKKLIR